MKQSQLDQIRKYTRIVADTGDFESMKAYHPQDATTNPSLVLKALQLPQYAAFFKKSLEAHKHKALSDPHVQEAIMDELLVSLGCQILQIVPGRVSTEVDASLSFNTQASLAKARSLIALYEKKGIARQRVLIKLATTWEGVQAARILEEEGIHCNMTLVFGLGQAIASAQAGATLISPFVGRILDWYKKSTGKDYTADNDPGVASVTTIYNYFKYFGYTTEVMGASFRNVGQILGLVGSDLLTISPQLLEELSTSTDPVVPKLSLAHAKAQPIQEIRVDEARFRWMLNEEAMATEKLSEGIRVFHQDAEKLRSLIAG